MAELDRDRLLALSYIPAARRSAVEALWHLDLALGNALSGGREPLISQIKLAWWREALERLDAEKAPAEPVLSALASLVLPRGVKGADLAAMERGWALLLTPDPLTPEQLAAYASARGGVLFRCSASLLGGSASEDVQRGGEAWALADLARHSGSETDAIAAAAGVRVRESAFRWPSRLRPLGMLVQLAQRDSAGPPWEEQGAPGRMWRMLRHRMTGR